jgi:hypothetical protein
MRRLGRLIAVGCMFGALGGCVTVPPPPPFVPVYALGSNGDTTQTAGNLAAWAFASPAHTQGNPIVAARAVIAIEYLAPALSNAGEFPATSPLVVSQLWSARQEVRQALGIAPDAPSQAVVNAMILVENALFAGNPAAAEQVLVPPVFTLGPEQTFARLNDLPPLPEANVATQQAQFQLLPFPSSGGNGARP